MRDLTDAEIIQSQWRVIDDPLIDPKLKQYARRIIECFQQGEKTDMTKANAIRQGDVMLWPATIPANAKQIRIRPIALGEHTGHHHSLVADPGVDLDDAVKMFEVQTGSGVETYIRVTGDGISLVHQQHKPHAIEKGSELVYIPQVENSDWGTTRVQD